MCIRDRSQDIKNPPFTSPNMRNTFISIDKALQWVGDNSRFQKRVIYVLSTQWGFISFLTMGMPFLFQSPKLLCFDPANPTKRWACDEYEACRSNNFEIDWTNSPNSLSTEFRLVCDEKYLVAFLGSIYYLGASLAGFVFPQISDHRGRRVGLLMSIGLGGLAIFLSGFANNVYVFMIAFGLAGWGLHGFETISLVYVTEVSAERFRNFSSVTLTTVWGAAQLILSPLVLFLNDWRAICTVLIGVPLMVSFIYTYKFLPETPRYLVSKNRFVDAKKALSNISFFNRRPRFEWRLEGEIMEYNKRFFRFYDVHHTTREEEDHELNLKRTANYGYMDLFKFPSLRGITFIMSFLWFIRCFVYFGLAFSLESLGAEMHVNMMFLGLSETIACLLSAPIKLKNERIRASKYSMMIMTAGSLLLVFFPMPDECYVHLNTCYQQYVTLFLATVVKFGITIYSSILFTYTSEVYPTTVRSLGYGFNMTVGRFTNIMMPLCIAYFQQNQVNPLIPFGLLGLLTIVVLRYTPETFKRDMPDYILETRQKEIPLMPLSGIAANRRNAALFLSEPLLPRKTGEWQSQQIHRFPEHFSFMHQHIDISKA
eukprot:TRINITY_DN2965_c0_g3_i3.p1 TRINITY_DN2965_c0_g3~~TRINITY_DN2965_c0_g3_i3.p1  ORF type:complete len:633 (-),score=34.63 TRINITY_DN2965_c0_g3_i3:160-1950(-)